MSTSRDPVIRRAHAIVTTRRPDKQTALFLQGGHDGNVTHKLVKQHSGPPLHPKNCKQTVDCGAAPVMFIWSDLVAPTGTGVANETKTGVTLAPIGDVGTTDIVWSGEPV